MKRFAINFPLTEGESPVSHMRFIHAHATIVSHRDSLLL